MDTLPTIVDESWYQRPPNVRQRVSSGGVVVRRELINHEMPGAVAVPGGHGGRVLVALTREGKHPLYVLPKGGVERGETPETAARREIAEETGLTQLQLLKPLGTRERCGFHKNLWVVTHFFLYATAQIEATPTDKKHLGVWWFPLNALPPMLWPEQRALIEEHAARICELLA